MMPQMESNEAGQGQPQGYEGYAPLPPSYEMPQAAPRQPFGAGKYQDDNYVEAVAQRLAQRLVQDGKLRQSSGHGKASAGQRLALAIVSVVMLVALSSTLLQAVGGFIGLVAFMFVSVIILLINFFLSR